MKIAFFSTHHFEKEFFTVGNLKHHHHFTFFEPALNQQTAPLAKDVEVVCAFVTDQLDSDTLQILKQNGVKLIALRSAGYNHVDLKTAEELGMSVVRVPAYSPYAVAEHGVALLLSLNRKIHKSYARVRELNFSLEGLMGFDLHGKTVGVVGTGHIGEVFATIMRGFGCEVIAYDPKVNASLLEKKIATYVTLDELYSRSDVISLHLPLFPETKHMIDSLALAKMKRGAILINTGRGALIDSVALTEALKSGHLGGAGLDVYEEEEGIFFNDLSDQVLKDDVLARLLTFPNVVMTSHQAFLTKEALEKIAATTLENISAFQAGNMVNQVQAKTHLAKK